MTRRDLLKCLGYSGLSLSLPINLIAAKKIDEHLQIAEIIQKKFKGREISILYPKGCLANLLPIRDELKRLTGVSLKFVEGSLDSISSEILLKDKLNNDQDNIDIGITSTFGIPDLVEAKAIVDLSNYLKQYEPKELSANQKYKLGDYYQGKFYGYQADGDTYILFLNKEFLTDPKAQEKYQKKYGIKLETPKTWQELDRQIQFFHSPDKNKFGGSLYRNSNYSIWEYWMRLHSKAMLPFDDNFQPQITNKKAIQALDELVKVTKYLEKDVYKNGLFENFKSFAEGNKYCNLGWGGTQKYLNSAKSKIKGKLIYSLPPGGQHSSKQFQMPYFNWGWNYVVCAKSKNVELAYLVSLFATSAEISKRAVREADGYFDPYLETHYQDQKIIDIYSKDFLQTHKEAMEKSIPDLYVRGQGSYYSILKDGIDGALKESLPSELVLANVEKRWESLTEKFGRENQKKQWAFLNKNYPKKFLEVIK